MFFKLLIVALGASGIRYALEWSAQIALNPFIYYFPVTLFAVLVCHARGLSLVRRRNVIVIALGFLLIEFFLAYKISSQRSIVCSVEQRSLCYGKVTSQKLIKISNDYSILRMDNQRPLDGNTWCANIISKDYYLFTKRVAAYATLDSCTSLAKPLSSNGIVTFDSFPSIRINLETGNVSSDHNIKEEKIFPDEPDGGALLKLLPAW
jgi:hypothetical protein